MTYRIVQNGGEAGQHFSTTHPGRKILGHNTARSSDLPRVRSASVMPVRRYN